jgi:hypothetical protein
MLRAVNRRHWVALFVALSCALLTGTARAKPPHGRLDPALATDPPPAAPDVKPPETPKPTAPPDDDLLPPPHPLVTMTVGVMLRELGKFDLANGSYNAEMDVTVACDSEPCQPDLDGSSESRRS